MSLQELNKNRNRFGAMNLPQGSEIHQAVENLLFRAVRAGVLPTSYNDLTWDSRKRVEGKALHHDIYDLKIVRDKLRKCLLCVRVAEGKGKWGVQTTEKRYVLLSYGKGRSLKIVEAPKHLVAAQAKHQARLGHTIEYVEHFNTKLDARYKAIQEQQLAELYDNAPDFN